MHLVLRIILGLLAAYFALIGFAFLIVPERGAEAMALIPQGSQGMASLRADFSAFFLAIAIFTGLSAWRADRLPLIAPFLLLLIAFTGRIVSLIADGVGPDAFRPMAIELVSMLVLLIGYATLGRGKQAK